MRFIRRALLGFATFVGASAVAGMAVRQLVPEWGNTDEPAFRLVGAMDGRGAVATSHQLGQVEIVATMGAVDLDLTQAHIVDGAWIKVTSVMGGVRVTVPSDWRVESRSSAIMAGSDNRTDPDASSDDAPVLVVDALLVMSGCEIRTAEVASGS